MWLGDMDISLRDRKVLPPACCVPWQHLLALHRLTRPLPQMQIVLTCIHWHRRQSSHMIIDYVKCRSCYSMESCGSEKCRVEWEKIPGEECSQVYRTLELRDCGDGLNRVLILQNQLQTDTAARHRPYTAPTDRQAHDQ